jgi:hypothetical protein
MIFTAVFKALQDLEYQTQVSTDNFLPGRLITGTGSAEEFFHSAGGQDGQLISIDPAYMYFSTVHFSPHLPALYYCHIFLLLNMNTAAFFKTAVQDFRG